MEDDQPSSRKIAESQGMSNTYLGNPTSHSKDPRSKETPLMCCHHGSDPRGRNLIVCIDGTANQFGRKNTNVIELYNMILKDDDGERKQLTWYNSGIGTYARPHWKSVKHWRKVIDHKIDLAIAWYFERTVQGAYRWLSDNYEAGDRIFLFGFSRGAFQVRVLSAMIDKVGLIRKGNEEQIPFAYELYADPKTNEPSPLVVPVGSQIPRRNIPSLEEKQPAVAQSGSNDVSMAQRFKKAFSHKDVKVHFVGAWDTVSSIGIVRGKQMLPGTIDGMKHVCFFRHALALDERRLKFSPEYAYGGSATETKLEDNAPKNKEGGSFLQKRLPFLKRLVKFRTHEEPSIDRSLESRGNAAQDISIAAAGKADITPAIIPSAQLLPDDVPQHTQEVWFAGTHSDIGGGNVFNEGMDRSRPPLRWMVYEAQAAGLRAEQFDRILSTSEQIEIKESLTTIWLILELLPLRRLTYTWPTSDPTTVKKKGKQVTRRPHLGSPRKVHNGQKIHGSLILSDKDKYIPKARPPPTSGKSDFWKDFREGNLPDWKAIDLFEGTQNLFDRFVDSEMKDLTVREILQKSTKTDFGRQALYEAVIGSLKGRTEIPTVPPDIKDVILRAAFNILARDPTRNSGMPLKLAFYSEVNPLLQDLRRHENTDYGSHFRQFMREFVEDGYRMDIRFEMKGHTHSVSSIAISPDGKHIISGSWDHSIRIWDSRTGAPIGDPLRGHTGDINTVTISPNGKLIASGSDDATVRVWDATTGNPVGKPFEGHTDRVYSVAFSPDSQYVASGSVDETIRIWDVEAGRCAGEPLQGHTGTVNTVVYSPDGKYLASGSSDGTIRIWDAITREPVGELVQSTTDIILSVAFSPDSSCIASGLSDWEVCIWNMETRKMVGEPLRGHTGWVWSMSFSPDGRRIASCSADRKVLVWNVETKEIEYTFPHNGWVTSVAFSRDGKSVVSGCYDRVVRVWDADPW